jgi:O-antigen ligase
MAHPATGARGAEFLIPMMAALPVALAVAMTKPSLSLPLIIGTVVLLVAFLSPLIGVYTLVFSMLLGPEVVVGALGAGATLGRGVTLRFDDFLLVLVGLGWLGHMAMSERAGRFAQTPLNRPIVYYTAACLLATLIGLLAGRVGPFGGFFFLLKYYEYFFLFFMVVNIVTDEKQIRLLVYASLITWALVSLYALTQVPSGSRVVAPFEGEFGEPNTLGGYLVFMMAIVAGFLLTPGATTKRLPLLILLGVSGVALQATLSRTSFLAAGAVMIVVLELLRRKNPAWLGATGIVLIVLLVLTPNSVTDRMMYTFTQPETSGQVQIAGVRLDTSTSDRVRSWQAGLEVFWQSPLWGLGVTGGPFMDAMYPRVLCETGILGFSAFCYLVWMLFRTGRGAYQSAPDPFSRALALGFILGLVGLVVHAIGANTFIIVRIMEPFWLYAALVVRTTLIQTEQAGLQPENPSQSRALEPQPRQRGDAPQIQPPC